MAEKILLITGIFPPDIGGPATYIPRLAKFLNQQGNTVRILTLGKQWKYETTSHYTIFVIPRQIPKIVRITITAIMIRILSLRVSRILANGLFEETYLSGVLKNRKSVAKVVGDPVWERFRNTKSSKVTMESFQSLDLPMKYRLQRRFLTAALKGFTEITCPGREIKEVVELWHPSLQVSLIPNGVSCLRVKSVLDSWDLITVSRLVSWKNIDFVINALKDVNVRIGIIGDGPERASLTKIAQNSISEVTFLGEIVSDDIPDLVSRTKIFVQMSEYEGMSFAILQAMMQGVAIVTSDAQGNTDVILDQQTGIVVKLGDVNGFLCAIEKLLNDNQYRANLGESARRFALQNFCEEMQFVKVKSLIGI